MVAAAIDKAVFLLRDVHQSSQEAERALKRDFPDLDFLDRVQTVSVASRLVRGTSAPLPTRLSAVQDPKSFMVAHERHGFLD